MTTGPHLIKRNVNNIPVFTWVGSIPLSKGEQRILRKGNITWTTLKFMWLAQVPLTLMVLTGWNIVLLFFTELKAYTVMYTLITVACSVISAHAFNCFYNIVRVRTMNRKYVTDIVLDLKALELLQKTTLLTPDKELVFNSKYSAPISISSPFITYFTYNSPPGERMFVGSVKRLQKDGALHYTIQFLGT